MEPTSAPSLWIAIARPDGLVNALVVAKSVGPRYAACHLIYEDSPAWERVGQDFGPGVFAGVHPIGKVRAVHGVLDASRYVRGLRRRQRVLRLLGIGARDTVLTFGSTTNLANALASAYPSVAKVHCLTVLQYADASQTPYQFGFRHTTAGWLQYRLLDWLGGVHRAMHLKRRRTHGDGARLKRLRKDLPAVFGAVVVLSNDGHGGPPEAGERVFNACFPSREEIACVQPATAADGADGGRIVVFFGTPFLLVRNLDPHHYAAVLNSCLDYLRRHYGATCRLVYRPHPAETSERRLLRLKGFVSQVDLEAAELFLLRGHAQVAAAYSVASTVSRTAFHYGLNGYSLWRCFPFEPTAATFFERLFGRVPDAFDIRSLDAPPVPYADEPASSPTGSSFTAGINAALEAAEKAVASRGRSPV